jgi:protein SCO1/2
MSRFPIYIKGLVALAAIVVFGYLAGTLTKQPPEPGPVVVTQGEAEIGGPFVLVDTKGRPFTDRDFQGKYALVYFGYSHCPDVCPIDMNKISMALNGLEQDGVSLDNLQPVFITVDPERDTPDVVAGFLQNFHSSFIGLTGTKDQMEVAAKAYKVYYQKILMSEHHEGEDGDPGLMNHSSFIYLMGPDGKYITHYDSSYSVTGLKDALAEVIG